MKIGRVGTIAGFGLVMGLVALAPSAVASADTAGTPIGTVTAEQYQGNFCDDFGAHVRVTVQGGNAGATYSAMATSVFQTPRSLPIDASGAGVVDLHNVVVSNGRGAVGTATVMITGSDYTVSVPVQINCRGNGGD